MATAQPTLNFITVLSESKRIINAHSRHFLALSVLFLLPLSFSLIVYPTIQQQLSLSLSLSQPNTLNTKTLLTFTYYPPFYQQQQQPIPSPKPLMLTLIYTIFVFTFSIFAVASLTYSIFHGFYGRPVKLISAIKSIFTSFLPLLATDIACNIIIYGILIVFGLLFFLVFKGIEFMGFQIAYSSPYFFGLCMVFWLVLVLVMLYLRVIWSLVSVVVVVESSWGFEPLKRSSSLIKGMKGVALSLALFFGFFVGVLEWSSIISGFKIGVAGGGWKSWAFVVQIVVTSTLNMLLMLYNFAANTVLYMSCKALHGELATEIAEEFAREYVSLPYDDGKVPHVVSVL